MTQQNEPRTQGSTQGNMQGSTQSNVQGSAQGAVQGEQRGAAPKGGAASDQERGVSTTRESGAPVSRSRTVSQRPRSGVTTTFGAGDPMRLMQRMARDMDQLFDQFGFGRGYGLAPAMGALFDDDLWSGASAGTSVGTAAGSPASTLASALWTPTVETFRRGDRIVVRADLPGVKKEDLHVDVQDDLLTLSGERREEHEEKRDSWYRSERSYGQFHRAIPLPEGVNRDDIDARFADGVLEVTFAAPKAEERQAKRIEIR